MSESDPGRILDLDDEPDDEGPPPTCAIEGCDREGAVPKKMRTPGSDEEPRDQYVCRYHRAVFVGVRVLILAAVIGAFLAAFFRF
jgi:hypothetical protein